MILSTRADVVLLQDIRLDSAGCSQLQQVISFNQFGNYDLYSNSNRNNGRGVCILLKKSLDIEIVNSIWSNDNNFIILDTLYKGKPLAFASIYGPTQQSDPDFFVNFYSYVTNLQHGNIIIGGDFNTVLCTKEPKSNIDLHNALTFPNKLHSVELNRLMSINALNDPYRLLYPTRKDFSYTPFGGRDYKSRLDFFLVSPNLIEKVSEVDYIPSLNKNLFDHSPVSLKLNYRTKSRIDVFKPRISKGQINVIGLKQICRIEIVNTLLEHSPPNLFLDFKRSIQLVNIEAENISKIVYNFYLNENRDLLLKQLIETRLFLLDTSLDHIPILEVIESILTPDYDVLLQVVLNNVLIRISSFQCRIRHAINSKLNELKMKFSQAKFKDDWNLADRFERKITEINHDRIISKLKNGPLWHILEGERPSRAFCSLYKNGNKQRDLSTVKDDNGLDFINSDVRNQYISDYFKNLYCEKPTSINIEHFLGDIVHSPYVQKKKLNQMEKDILDSPLTLNELDESLKNSNKNSCGGGDGFSFLSIQLIWPYIRVLVLKSFNHMLTKGELSANMADVQIKLIPKKSDLTKIGSWRPISLLNVCYKIVSSCITSRLKLVIDKVCSINQKGFSSQKTLPMNVINIANSISQLNETGTEAFIFNSDFCKAFDFVNHSYILTVLSFFNFGPIFINMIKTILTGRRGGIICDGGIGPSFFFKSGSGQGDGPSPLIFNISLEPLLIKIESDKRFDRLIIPYDNVAICPPLAYAYADDLLNLLKATIRNVSIIDSIYDEFRKLSGLTINKQKSSICPINASNVFLDHINNNTSFQVVREFTILGFRLNDNMSNLNVNFDAVIEKIKSIINFWDKYKLTIFGRRAIANTYLFGQVCHIGSVLSPTNEQTRTLNALITNYIKGRDCISINRIRSSTKDGGLNIPDVKLFLDGIRTNMLSKYSSIMDEWMKPIRHCEISGGNNLVHDLSDHLINKYPYSRIILESKNVFLSSFAEFGRNFYKTPIFYNEKWLNYKKKPLTPVDLFSNIVIRSKAATFTLENFLTENLNTRSKNNIEIIGNITITNADYHRICSLCSRLKKQYRHKVGESFCPSSLLTKKKGGSKRFKRFLCYTKSSNPSLNNRISKIDPQDRESLDINNLNALIMRNFTTSLNRQNALKFISNTIPLANRKTKFLQDIDSRCTFCLKAGQWVCYKESYSHTFTQCPELAHIRQILLDIDLFEVNISENNILFGSPKGQTFAVEYFNMLLIAYVNFILLEKGKKVLPSYNTFIEYLEVFFSNAARSNSRARHFLSKVSLLNADYPNAEPYLLTL